LHRKQSFLACRKIPFSSHSLYKEKRCGGKDLIELEEEARKEEEGCVFCAIASHRMHAEIVYEDNLTMAFMDINPASTGHTLVIPKRHFRNIRREL